MRITTVLALLLLSGQVSAQTGDVPDRVARAQAQYEELRCDSGNSQNMTLCAVLNSIVEQDKITRERRARDAQVDQATVEESNRRAAYDASPEGQAELARYYKGMAGVVQTYQKNFAPLEPKVCTKPITQQDGTVVYVSYKCIMSPQP